MQTPQGEAFDPKRRQTDRHPETSPSYSDAAEHYDRPSAHTGRDTSARFVRRAVLREEMRQRHINSLSGRQQQGFSIFLVSFG